jgi:hypothetical protein
LEASLRSLREQLSERESDLSVLTKEKQLLQENLDRQRSANQELHSLRAKVDELQAEIRNIRNQRSAAASGSANRADASRAVEEEARKMGEFVNLQSLSPHLVSAEMRAESMSNLFRKAQVDGPLRLGALKLLSGFRDRPDEVLPTLFAATMETNLLVQEVSTMLIVKHFGKKAAPFLESQTNSADAAVSQAATELLQKLR